MKTQLLTSELTTSMQFASKQILTTRKFILAVYRVLMKNQPRSAFYNAVTLVFLLFHTLMMSPKFQKLILLNKCMCPLTKGAL